MLPAVLARLHPEFGGFHPRFTAGFEMCLLSSLDFLIQKSAVVSKERVLLYNYGGLWMDSDVLMIRDLAPLLEEDLEFSVGYLPSGK